MNNPELIESRHRYDAFISYSHAADGQLAPAVQRCLHRLAKPWYRPRALWVFRDEVSLSASPDLWTTIETALRETRYFILMASPAAARSAWVRQEVAFWQANRERETFLIVLTNGVVCWDDAAGDFDWTRTTALPPELRGWFRVEPLWVDLSWARSETQLSVRNSRFRDKVAALAAPVHGMAKDELDSEDVRRHRVFARVRGAVITAISLLLVATVGAGLVAWQQRNEAESRARIATSQALAARAQVLATAESRLAVQLALYAYQLSPTFEAKSAMATLMEANSHARRHFRAGADRLIGFRGANAVAANRVALSGDGRILAYYSQFDELDKVRVYDANSHREIGSIPTTLGQQSSQNSSGMALNYDGRRLVTFDNGTAVVWDLSSRASIQKLPLGSSLMSAAISPDGRWVATRETTPGQGAAQVAVWNVDDGTQVGSWDTSGPYPEMKFSSDSRRLLVISANDGAYRRFDLVEAIWSASEPFPRMVNAFVHADASGSRAVVLIERELQMWDLRTQRQLVARPANNTASSGIEISADGQLVLIGTMTGQVDVYDGALQHLIELNRFQRGVTDMAISADGRQVATTSENGSLTLSTPHEQHHQATWETGDYNRVTLDGRVALKRRENSTELWDVATHEKRGELRFPVPDDYAADTTAGGERVATLGNGVLNLWDPVTAAPRGWLRVEPARGAVRDPVLRFLPDDRHLAGVTERGPVVIDSASLTIRQRLDVEGEVAVSAGRQVTVRADRQVAVSADRRTVAVLMDGMGRLPRVEIWRWGESGRLNHVRKVALPAGFQGYNRFTVSSDGSLMAMGDVDGRLHVIGTDGQGQPKVLDAGLGHRTNGVAFSDDGKIIVQDGNWRGQSGLLLWDVDQGEPLAHWRLPKSEPYGTGLIQLIAGPDSAIMTAGQDKEVRRWLVGIEEWHDVLCGIAGDELTERERQQYLPDVTVEAPCQSR